MGCWFVCILVLIFVLVCVVLLDVILFVLLLTGFQWPPCHVLLAGFVLLPPVFQGSTTRLLHETLSSFYILHPILTGPAAWCPSLFGPGGGPGARAKRAERALVGPLGGPSSGTAKWSQNWGRRYIFSYRSRPFSGPENGPGIPSVFNFQTAKKLTPANEKLKTSGRRRGAPRPPAGGVHVSLFTGGGHFARSGRFVRFACASLEASS